ncbi:Non-histone chromosomal protein 6 [Apophysomyces sp. BC1034]|nr:Non-histone chromosomal protein 6 [Apophysomyces sp. BC1015]KAG0178866.1 Non-histone chromosomal protein 6 [Apophysomyces sp. BC1021]KAG0189199.1 Non-histone chromosomal protein 6 [Apophysomyces sp. BC1034]
MFDGDELTRRQIGEALYNVGEGLRQLGVALGAHVEAQTESTAEPSKKKRKQRAPKDPNAPKRFMGSYIHFANEHRDQVKADHPDANQKEIVQMLGEMWQNLSEDEKEPYKKIFEQDKKRYAKELEEYKGHAAEEQEGTETVFTPTPEATNSSESAESSDEEEEVKAQPEKPVVPEKKTTKKAKEVAPAAVKKAVIKKEQKSPNPKLAKRGKKFASDEGSEKQPKKKAKKVTKE